MPKVRRRKLPQPLLIHLLARMRQRNILEDQIIVLAAVRLRVQQGVEMNIFSRADAMSRVLRT